MKVKNQMEKLLDASEVSEYLHISKRKFEQLLSQGGGPRHFLIGRQRRWRAGDINEWIDLRLRETTSFTDRRTLEETCIENDK
jgi:excisionase family DNA binding protein